MVEHVTVAQETGRPVAQSPAECLVRPANGEGADDPAFTFLFLIMPSQYRCSGTRKGRGV